MSSNGGLGLSGVVVQFYDVLYATDLRPLMC